MVTRGRDFVGVTEGEVLHGRKLGTVKRDGTSLLACATQRNDEFSCYSFRSFLPKSCRP